MHKMKIAMDSDLRAYILTKRETIPVEEADLTEVSAVVLRDSQAEHWGDVVRNTGFGIPIFLIHSPATALPGNALGRVRGVFNFALANAASYGRQVDAVAER